MKQKGLGAIFDMRDERESSHGALDRELPSAVTGKVERGRTGGQSRSSSVDKLSFRCLLDRTRRSESYLHRDGHQIHKTEEIPQGSGVDGEEERNRTERWGSSMIREQDPAKEAEKEWLEREKEENQEIG